MILLAWFSSGYLMMVLCRFLASSCPTSQPRWPSPGDERILRGILEMNSFRLSPGIVGQFPSRSFGLEKQPGYSGILRYTSSFIYPKVLVNFLTAMNNIEQLHS